MKKFLLILTLAGVVNSSFAEPSFDLGMTSVLYSTYSGDIDSMYKIEVLREEATTHLAEGKMSNPSESMIAFLKVAKNKFKGKSDLEILEILVKTIE
jgi:hypothetical protein